MRRFIKRPDLGYVALPGVGPLKEGMVLVGDQFAKHVPRFLVEVPPTHDGLPLESREPQTGPVPLTEPAPIAPMPDQRQQLEEDAPTAAPVKRPRGRPRKYPLPG
jgi:hypothetical protein